MCITLLYLYRLVQFLTLRSVIWLRVLKWAVANVQNYFFGSLLMVFGIEITADWLIFSYFKVCCVPVQTRGRGGGRINMYGVHAYMHVETAPASWMCNT